MTPIEVILVAIAILLFLIYVEVRYISKRLQPKEKTALEQLDELKIQESRWAAERDAQNELSRLLGKQ